MEGDRPSKRQRLIGWVVGGLTQSVERQRGLIGWLVQFTRSAGGAALGLIQNTPPPIPPDVWMKIAEFLPRKCFNNLTYTCKAIHEASKNPSVDVKWPECACLFLWDFPCIIAFSPDGKMLATVGPDFERLKLWDVLHGELGVSDVDDPYLGGRSIIFAPDGRFCTVTEARIPGYGLGLRVLKENLQERENESDDVAENIRQFIPAPEPVAMFELIVWMSDSNSFVAMGWGQITGDYEDGFAVNRRLRLKFESGVEGYFRQSGSPSRDLLFERLERLYRNFYFLWESLISISQSPKFAELCDSPDLTMEDELAFLDEIESLCGIDDDDDGDEDITKIATIFPSIQNPAIFYVQNDEGIVLAVEMYSDASRTLPSLRVVAQSPAFAYNASSNLKGGQFGLEVPGTSIVAMRSYDQDNQVHDIELFELFELDVEKRSLERVVLPCDAFHLVEKARQKGFLLSKEYVLRTFTFSPDGKSLVMNIDLPGNRRNHPTEARIFSV